MIGSAAWERAASWGWAAAAGTALATAWPLYGAPGEAADGTGAWPRVSALTPPDGRGTLVLFLHPRCPCSRVSVEEAEWLRAREPDARTIVVLVEPPGAPDGFADADGLESRLREKPWLEVHRDSGAREAASFGARTSGQSFVYDRLGRLAYRGGLTAGRGHAGENAGRRSALSALRGEGRQADYPVFGCALAHRSRRKS